MTELHIGVAGPCSPAAFAADLDIAPCLLPRGLGGTPVNHLVRAWLDGGYKVTLATLDSSHAGDRLSVFRGKRLTLTIGRYRPRKRARDAFKYERKNITDGLNLYKPDVVSAHWSYEFALGAIATGIPTMVTVHDVPREIFRIQPTPYRLVRWWMHRQTMARAPRIAFNSPYTQKKIGNRCAANGVVLPNALPDEYFQLKVRRPPDPQAPRYITINNGFSPRKNVGRLLVAFQQVLKQISGARLQLVGKGFEADGKAMEWARQRGLMNGVAFIGPVEYDDAFNRIRNADILVHPAIEESFGLTLVEAAAAGTPVIAGCRSGAVPWILAGGDAGALVDVAKVSELASTMINLAQAPGIWQQLRARAFVLAKDRFSISRVATDYIRELIDLCP
jgi:L-malate glycosyltransferase